VAALVSVTLAGVVLVRDWRAVHVGSAWRLIGSAVFGIRFGLLLLTTVCEPVVKAVLAAVIIAFSVYGQARSPARDCQNYHRGADQAALRAARADGVLTGGFAPQGWLTEDGPTPWLAGRCLVSTNPARVR
jgi:uncharacterized membrane protein YfcA